MSVRVLLADDHLLFRSAVRALLERENIEIAAEASDGREAVKLALQLQPDVAILDVFMPLLNGLDTAREIARVSPGTRTLLFSTHTNPRYLHEALACGVSGHVSKAGAVTNLLFAIREVAAGAVYLDPITARAMLDDPAGDPAADSDRLTLRERQVLQLIAEGRTTKEIADLLDISSKTAESHRQRIMAKLNLDEPAQLVRYAVRKGLIEARAVPEDPPVQALHLHG